MQDEKDVRCECVVHSLLSRDGRKTMTRKPYFGFNHWLIIICITFVSLSYLVLYVAVNSLPAPSTLAAVAWNVETVDASAGIAGDGISMAFDASGLPAVCYYDSTSGDLNFSSRATGGWVSELVDETTVVMGKGCDIAYNSSGSHFVVSYYNSTGGDLRYGRRDGGGAGSGCTSTQWNCEDVDTTGVVGEYSSIAINPSNGRTTIAYYDGTVGASQYAYRVGSGGGSGCADTDWTCEAIEDGGVATDYGKYIDLVFQSNGTPHVAYSDESGVADVALHYAARDGSTGSGDCQSNWYCEEIEDRGNALIGRYPSLVLDSLSVPRILYYHSGDFDLYYTTRKTTISANKDPNTGAGCDDNDWDCSIVAVDGGQYVSVSITSGDILHFSYNKTVGGVEYGYGTPELWTFESITSVGGTDSNIGLNNSGNYVVAYLGNINDANYAERVVTALPSDTSRSADASGQRLSTINLNNVFSDTPIGGDSLGLGTGDAGVDGLDVNAPGIAPGRVTVPTFNNKFTDSFQPKLRLALSELDRERNQLDRVELLRAEVDGRANKIVRDENYRPIAVFRDFTDKDLVDRFARPGVIYKYVVKVSDTFGNFKISETPIERAVPCAFVRMTDINGYPVPNQYRLTSTSCDAGNIDRYLLDVFSDLGENENIIRNKLTDSPSDLPIANSMGLNPDRALELLQEILAGNIVTNLVSGRTVEPLGQVRENLNVETEKIYTDVEKILEQRNQDVLDTLRDMIDERLGVREKVIASNFTSFDEKTFVDDVVSRALGYEKFKTAGLVLVDHPVVRFDKGDKISISGRALPRSDVYVQLKGSTRGTTDSQWLTTTAGPGGKWEMEINTANLPIGLYQLMGYTDLPLREVKTPILDFAYIAVASRQKLQEDLEEETEKIIEENPELLEEQNKRALRDIEDRLRGLDSRDDIIALLNDGLKGWDTASISKLLDKLKEVDAGNKFNDILAILSLIPDGGTVLNQLQQLIDDGLTLGDILDRLRENQPCLVARTCKLRDLFPTLLAREIPQVTLPTLDDLRGIEDDAPCSQYDSRDNLGYVRIPNDVQGGTGLRAKIKCYLVWEPLNQKFWPKLEVNQYRDILPPPFVLISRGIYNPETGKRDLGNDRIENALDEGQLLGKVEVNVNVNNVIAELGDRALFYNFTDQDPTGALSQVEDIEELKNLILLLIGKQTGNLDEITNLNNFNNVTDDLGIEGVDQIRSFFGSSAIGGQYSLRNVLMYRWLKDSSTESGGSWAPVRQAYYNFKTGFMTFSTNQLGVYGLGIRRVDF